MKNRFLLFPLAWLVAFGGLAAQPARPGEPASEASLYGAGPSTPPQMFQKAPLPTVPQGGANLTGNSAKSNSPINNLNGALPAATSLVPPAGAGNTTNPAANGTTGTADVGNVSSQAKPSFIPSGQDLSNFPLPATFSSIDNEHHLLPGDQIALKIEEDRDAPQLLLVKEDGTITVPWTNEVLKVDGATLRATVEQIKSVLSKPGLNFYKDGHPNILAALYHSDQSRGRVYINGAVKKPGYVSIPFDNILTLWDVIQAANGFRGDEDADHVSIIHASNKSSTTTTTSANATATSPAAGTPPASIPADSAGDNVTVVNIADMLKNGRVPDMPVRPGDFVSVPSKTESTGYITIVGPGVGRPGTIPLSPTQCHLVSQAVLIAGFDKFSKLEAVHLIRNIVDPKTGKTTRTDTPVNVEEIINKGITTTDKELQNGDYIVVDQRWLLTPWS